MKKAAFILLVLILSFTIWYIHADKKGAVTYYDPMYENFPVLYAQLSFEERQCLAEKLGTIRANEIGTLSIELNEIEKSAITQCVY